MKKRIISILVCASLICAINSTAIGAEYPESLTESDIIGDAEVAAENPIVPEDVLNEENEADVPMIESTDSAESEDFQDWEFDIAPDLETNSPGETGDESCIIQPDVLTEDDVEKAAETSDYTSESESVESVDDTLAKEDELVGASVSLDAASRTQAAIRKFVLASGADEKAPVSYTTKPDTASGSYAAGALSDDSLKNALAMLNNFRYIAGLDYKVKLNSTYTQKAQAAALLLAVNGELSSAPKKPSGMTATLYNKGYSGAQNSNLNYGASTLGSAALTWIRDNSVLSRPFLPNRSAFLEPNLGKVGFGAVGKYYTAYINDASAASSVTKVAWPARNMPLDYFSDSDPWSVSGVKINDIAKVKVTLVRTRDNQTWTFSGSTKTIDINSGYFSCSKGDDSIVTFKPNGVTYEPGDKFSVKIAGTAEGTIAYTVSFFELVPLEKVQLKKTSLKLEYGRSQSLYYELTPENATSRKAVWSSSDPSVCSVSSYGNVKANKLGTAVITLQMGDKASTCKVTVTKRSIAITTGFAIEPPFYYYSGAECKPKFSKYSVDNVNLTEGKDYTLSYQNNVRPGNGTIVITGIGNYTETANYRFNIYPFEDVRDPAHPYYTAICWAVENGITKGYTGTHIFGINDACTRGHAVQFLWRMAGKPKPASGAMKFIDVPKSHPYYNAILWAAQKNIAIGYPAYKEFRPNKPCTRGQICTFIWRYLGWKEPKTTTNPYKDALTPSYRKAIIWMTENNLAKGYPDKTFRDPQSCTRGMMVKYLYNSRDLKK